MSVSAARFADMSLKKNLFLSELWTSASPQAHLSLGSFLSIPAEDPSYLMCTSAHAVCCIESFYSWSLPPG